MPNPIADLPVKNGQAGINRKGNIMSGSFNERTDITDKIAGNNLNWVSASLKL